MGRADFFVNFTYGVTLLAPLVAWLGFRMAREKRHRAHRNLQIALVVLGWISVLVLEGRIRLQGGSGSFIGAAPEAYRAWARRLLWIHVSLAVVTYTAWAWLAVVSTRRFRHVLPGPFSRLHRQMGSWVFGGLCFTALSATGMYVLTFVL